MLFRSAESYSDITTQNLPPALRAVDAELVGESSAALQKPSSAFSDASTKLLALITQDMASFGIKSGESELSLRKGTVRPLDFFA